MTVRRTINLIILTLVLSISAAAQELYVSRLEFPSKVITIPNGNLLVTQTGTQPNTGRVTMIAPGGGARDLIAGLPSGLAAPGLDPDGTNGLYLAGRTLYIANGEGEVLRNGTVARTTIPNPAGISSPLFSSILKVTFARDVDQYQSTFRLRPQDHLALALGITVSLDDGSGNTAAAELVTNFPDTFPDAVAIYRNSHPYGLTMHPGVPDTLFTVDAGMNLVWQTNVTTGRTRALAQFPLLPNTGAGPPTLEPVPDSVKACGDQLLVTMLGGGPFGPGNSRIVMVNPKTGDTTPFLSSLNSAIDIACISRPASDFLSFFRGQTETNSFLVLEFSTNQGATPPLPGRLLRYDGGGAAPTVVLGGLNGTTSLAIDATSGIAYIVSRTDGTILTARYR